MGRPAAPVLVTVVLASLAGCATTLGAGDVPGEIAAGEAPAPAATTQPLGAPIASPRPAEGGTPIAVDAAGEDAPAEPSDVAPGPAPADAGPDVAGSPRVGPGLPAGPLPLRGVHLAGAEFGEPLPGVEGYDYEWPTTAEIDYFAAKGMSLVRIGFMWERLQPRAYGAFEAAYFAKLDALVRHAAARGLYVVLDPHNFARYYDDVIGGPGCPNAVFADFWGRLARSYGGESHVIFDLVNEPHDMPTEQWVGAANAAIAAIRAAGAPNLVEVPGNAWTGAWTWFDTDYGTANAVAMLGIVDPLDNYVIEAHQYLDAEGGGETYRCVGSTVGTQRVQAWLGWLRAHGKRGILGEFAGGRGADCRAAIGDLLKTLEASSDVLVGFTWWAAGPAWGDYDFSLEPSPGDAVQMSWLAPYLF